MFGIKRKQLFILVIVFLLLAVITAGIMAYAAGTQLTWTVIAGGGGTAQSGDRIMQHTIGQAFTGSARGDTYELGLGYWSGVARAVPPPRENQVYMPVVNSPVRRISSAPQ